MAAFSVKVDMSHPLSLKFVTADTISSSVSETLRLGSRRQLKVEALKWPR